MARYIDADALIENIKRVYCTDCNNHNGIYRCACGTADAIDMIDDAPTANVAPRADWISVEERLPERNGRYLTHCKIEGQSLVCILYYCNVGGFNEGTVTHWMPLPEPPVMKGGAE